MFFLTGPFPQLPTILTLHAVFTISPQMLAWRCLTPNCISPPPVPWFACNLCASMTLHALVVSKTLLTMCSSQSTHGEKPTCQCRRWGFDPYVGKSLQGRSPGGGNGNAVQDSCLGNAMDRRNLEASIHGIPRVRHDLVTKQQQNWAQGWALKRFEFMQYGFKDNFS